MSRSKTPTKPSRRRPRVLVLEPLPLTGSARAITRAGAIAVSIDPRKITKRTIELIESSEWDALLLTGGSDIDPRRYGVKRPHHRVYGVDEVRDDVEVYALEYARKRDLPVLGICRGCQLINVEAGGTLVQHIGEKHRRCWHPVHADGLLREVVGVGAAFRVRSLHHQKVRKAAPGFAIIGRAHDNTAEAIASDDGRCLGVQFHPEMDAGARYAQGIFRWLVLEAARRAQLATPSIVDPWKVRGNGKPRKGKGKSRKGQLSLVSNGRSWLDDDDPRQLVASTVNGQPRNRQAGTRTFAPPVRVSWFCPNCAIRFDNADDRAAHIAAHVCG